MHLTFPTRGRYAAQIPSGGGMFAALLATVVLRIRNRHYRRMCTAEELDADADSAPDVYQNKPKDA